ncbi:MAG: hypothetical protein ACREP9_09000, partial [Candidatus Dormibacteraceae bacterium]
FERYHRVSVMRKNGSRYETQFFSCGQCSVMFLNPTQFQCIQHRSAQHRVSAHRYTASTPRVIKEMGKRGMD